MPLTDTGPFVPYRERAPRTADLRELRAEFLLQRALHDDPTAHERTESFERLFREAARQGRPLDALSRYSTDEVERFFDRTRPGPDGHVYWDGGKSFRQNNGKYRVPRRWWWEHLHGQTSQYDDIVPNCGERNCINPEHCITGRDLRRRKYSDEMMIGALQVAAMRLGHAPSRSEWERGGWSPVVFVYQLRFGSWTQALKAAGMEPHFHPGSNTNTPEVSIAALREAARVLGHPPSSVEFRTKAITAHLHSRGLPTAPAAIKKQLGGTWASAMRAAGMEAVSVGKITTEATAVAAVRAAAAFLGHPPGHNEFLTAPVRKHLVSLGLPSTTKTVKSKLGAAWPDCLRRAGVT